jgi:antitoxin component of MazEF toxin-antitoxin module
MVREIKTLEKVIRVGNSIGITIGKEVKDLLDLKPGDYLQVTYEKVKRENNDSPKEVTIKDESK